MTVVWNKNGDPGQPENDRRELPSCPKCEASNPSRLEQISAESQLRWFRCQKCSHIWNKGPRMGGQ